MDRDRLFLQPMAQQILAGPEGDWTGKTDPRVRKKLQDRVNQRISRQRKKLRSLRYESVLNEGNQPGSGTWGDGSVVLHSPQHEHHNTLLGVGLDSFTACEPDSHRTEVFMRQFSAWMQREYVQGSPCTDNLLNLVRFNVTRALVINARILGLSSQSMSRESRSPLTSTDVVGTVPDCLPPSLRPTTLQLVIPHHPWVDLLPVAEMRDNLLRRDENSYDAAQLCRDMRGFQEVKDSRGGVTVWGEPWDPCGWEVTEAFARKWPWVIQGCPGLIESTNYWRSTRNEPPLRLMSSETPMHATGQPRVEEVE